MKVHKYSEFSVVTMRIGSEFDIKSNNYQIITDSNSKQNMKFPQFSYKQQK